jgi:hypothetical protein
MMPDRSWFGSTGEFIVATEDEADQMTDAEHALYSVCHENFDSCLVVERKLADQTKALHETVAEINEITDKLSSAPQISHTSLVRQMIDQARDDA